MSIGGHDLDSVEIVDANLLDHKRVHREVHHLVVQDNSSLDIVHNVNVPKVCMKRFLV